MSAIRNFAFDWLFNASVQIGLFAILTAALSRFVAKTRATYQHWFFLAIFALCVTVPVMNTLWQIPPSVVTKGSQQLTQAPAKANHFLWIWNGHSEAHHSIALAPGAKSALLIMWLLFSLYRLIQFSRGIYRVRRLRTDAIPIPRSEMGRARSILDAHGIALLQSSALDDPATVGLFRPAIILPSKVIAALNEVDLTAILAHEYGHIRRKDFLVHLLCQLAALPLVWHPGIQYLMSRISQTRELACDEYAAIRVGKRIVYARTLLRLASLCLQVPRSSAMELGFFNNDNLEDRIMMLTEKRTSLSRAGVASLALATGLLFGSITVIARAVSLQEPLASGNRAQQFAGTWHWMFQGHSFSTMILVQNGSGYTGSVTPSRIALDGNGELTKADPSEDSAPAPISNTKLEGNGLHVTVVDGNEPFEFVVTLKDAAHAEIHPVGAPPNMKPILAERAN